MGTPKFFYAYSRFMKVSDLEEKFPICNILKRGKKHDKNENKKLKFKGHPQKIPKPICDHKFQSCH